MEVRDVSLCANLLSFTQWFSIRGDFSPREHSEISEAFSGVTNVGSRDREFYGIEWVGRDQGCC